MAGTSPAIHVVSFLTMRRLSLALHQHRPSALRPLVLAHDAETPRHVGIGFEQAAEVAAEAVLVELVVRLDVPQPARIRGNLVGHHDPHQIVFPEPAAFHLEINQANADAEEQAAQEVVDADSQRHDVVDLLRHRPAERGDMLFRHHRIAELLVLVIKLDDRARQLRTLLDAEALGERARRDVADRHRQRNDLDLADQLLAHVEPADEVRRHADVVQPLEQILRDAIIEDALALDHLVLLGIEGRCIVLEMLNQGARFRTLIEDLRLAFINAASAAHRSVPWFVKVHRVPWLQCGIEVRGGESGRHQETESNAYPFTPKIYPNDLVSTIDISRLLFARNGKILRRWIALTTLTCCAKRAKSLA